MSNTAYEGNIRRYFVQNATEQDLYGSYVDYATAAEFDHIRSVFLIRTFFRASTNWIVNELPEWAEKFKAKYPEKHVVELFKEDVVRFEEFEIFVTPECAERVYAPEAQKQVKCILLNIGYGNAAISNN